MKKLVVLLVLISVSVKPSWSQIPNCDCKSDLDFIVQKLKKHHLTRNKLKIIGY